MKSIPLIFLVLLLFTTCKKEEPPTQCNEANTVKFPADAVRKAFFKDSTYWIYEDSATGQIDSVWVVNSKISSINRYENTILHKRCYQELSYELNSRLGDSTRVSLQLNYAEDNTEYSKIGFFVYYHSFHVGRLNNYSSDRFILEGDTYRVHTFEGDTLMFLDDITIQNIKYNNIIHRINAPFNITHDICKDVWYADNVGIIKYRMQNNSVWEILRCKIRQ